MAILDDTVSSTLTATATLDRDSLLDAAMSQAFGVEVVLSSGTVAFVTWSEALGASVILTPDRVVDSSVQASLQAMVSFAVATELFATIVSYIEAGFSVPVFDSEGNVWVVSDTGKTTRYENFGYTGFACLAGHQYGVKADGIYRLDGGDDAGEPIRASINFGKKSLGAGQQVNVPSCYIGVSSTGKMYLKVRDQRSEYLYAARGSSEDLSTQRFDLGRGLRASYLTFELLNSDGCDFELDAVDFMAVKLSRRI